MSAVKVWVIAGALAVLIGNNTASAAADTVRASKSDEDNKSEPIETVAIDAGLTGARPYSLYGNLGILLAPPAGLDVSGFRLRFEAVGGQYSYPQDSVRIYGLSEDVKLLLGYSLNWNENSILLMAGGAVEHAKDLSSPNGDPTAPVPPGTRFGLALKTEVNLKPTEQSILYADADYSTAVQEYYVELKAGYAAFSPKIYVGPKVVFLGNENVNQYRVGAFVGGIKVGKVELGFSGGYLRDSIQGSGFFAGTDLYVQY